MRTLKETVTQNCIESKQNNSKFNMFKHQGLQSEYVVFRKFASRTRSDFDRKPAQEKPQRGGFPEAKKLNLSRTGYIKLDDKERQMTKPKKLKRIGEIAYAMAEFPLMP